MNRYYTGVGSRETPKNIMELMGRISHRLSSEGIILRSGGAPGADTAFQSKSEHNEIYIPWNGFQDLYHDGEQVFLSELERHLYQAKTIAREVHPAWSQLTPAAQKLHTRNLFQVLGRDLQTPSKFLVCWSKPDLKTGVPTGGTRTAWMIAIHSGVRCFNIYFLDHLELFQEVVQKGSGALDEYL